MFPSAGIRIFQLERTLSWVDEERLATAEESEDEDAAADVSAMYRVRGALVRRAAPRYAPACRRL